MSLLWYALKIDMSRKKGNIAEDLAVSYLQEKGFLILERNFYTLFGEIDIIAQHGRVMHFIEVKSGNNFEPIYNVTPKKLEKIFKSIQVYMLKNKLDIAYCIDVVILSKNRIEFIENITL